MIHNLIYTIVDSECAVLCFLVISESENLCSCVNTCTGCAVSSLLTAHFEGLEFEVMCKRLT